VLDSDKLSNALCANICYIMWMVYSWTCKIFIIIMHGLANCWYLYLTCVHVLTGVCRGFAQFLYAKSRILSQNQQIHKIINKYKMHCIFGCNKYLCFFDGYPLRMAIYLPKRI
jgi:hypothetical protein